MAHESIRRGGGIETSGALGGGTDAGNAEKEFPGLGILSVTVVILAFLMSLIGCHEEASPAAQENWVTVHLNDSLSRYHSVDVLILSAADTSQILGKAWSGKLENPGSLPAYRLPDGASPAVVVRVKGYDAQGLLVLDLLIRKEGGVQVVSSLLPVPVKPTPSVRLASLGLSPGSLVPAFDSLVDDYAVNLPYDQSSIILTPVPAVDTAEIRVEGVRLPRGVPTDPIELHVGQNEISIRVSVGDFTGIYSVKVDRAGRGDPPLDTVKPGDPQMMDWKYKTTVHFNVPYLGIGKGQVEEFPLLVRLDKVNFNFSQARSKGQDIRFARAGKLIDHEVTRWDTAAEVAEVWVRLDTVRLDTAFAPLHMYWGNAAAPTVSDGAKVFRSTGGHAGVWHLNESGKGEGDEYKDATGRYHGRGEGGSRKGPRRISGVVGYGQNFRFGGTPGTILIPGSFDPGPQWTMHLWIKSEGNSKGVIFQKWNSWAENDMRFQVTVQDGTGQKIAIHRAGAGSLYTDIYVPDQFIFLGITYDGEKVSFYVDGFLRESIHPWKQGSNPGGAVLIGASNYQGSDLNFNGSLDELWFANTPRSPAWMRLAYENQRPFSYLVTVGTVPGGDPPKPIPDLPGIVVTPGFIDSLLKGLLP